jgi:hypothetical protein
MNDLRTDQYTYVDRGCPVRTDLHPADDFVEIVLGEYRFGGDTLRLVVNDPDKLLQLTETFHDARDKLINHLHAKAQLTGRHHMTVDASFSGDGSPSVMTTP